MVNGQNHIDTILPSMAKPILENRPNVKTILPNKQIETGNAYFHGVKLTTALSWKVKGIFNGLTLPKINKNSTSIKKSRP